MARIRLFVLIAAGAGVACSVQLKAPSAELAIRCDKPAQCPDGTICVVDVGHCISEDSDCITRQSGEPEPMENGMACPLAGETGQCRDGTCVVSVCGDELAGPDEECDDGNQTAGDGCEPDCTFTNLCGNGTQDQGETCDDGNRVTESECPYGTPACTLCDASCATELSLTGRYCGDGTNDAEETCDDGNTVTETECAYGTPSCTLCDAACLTVLELTGRYCGDGTDDPEETCDDGNTVTESECVYGTPTCTLCDASCATELSLTGRYCGDGTNDSEETCDDGNEVTELECPYGYETCELCDAGCQTTLTLTGSYCGDGILDSGETCDDGNTVTESSCEYDTHFCTTCDSTCNAELSLTGSFCGDAIMDVGYEDCDVGPQADGSGCVGCVLDYECGDGIVSWAMEGCDDRNDTTGDGCDACQLEAGWHCHAAYPFPDCMIVRDSCSGAPNGDLCENDTLVDLTYDVCMSSNCVSPGCGNESCNGGSIAFSANDFERVATTAQPVVIDHGNGLTWQGCSAGQAGASCDIGTVQQMTWYWAVWYCEGLSWAGYTDWHLPDRGDLMSIVDTTSGSALGDGLPTIDLTVFPNTTVGTTSFDLRSFWWTSATEVEAANDDDAYYVSFDVGTNTVNAKGASMKARCVRRTR